MPERIMTAHAFTLLELVLVLVILAIALAAVAPTLSGFGVGRRTEEAAAQFVTLTRWAHTQAVTDGCTYRIAVDMQSNRWWLQVAEDDDFTDVTGPFGHVFTCPEDVTIDTDAQTDQAIRCIRFDPSGRCDLANVRFKGPKGEVQITCDAPMDDYHIVRDAEVAP
jgi:prepilin-type N-terminal cleavage/methylation domain-containing protein